MKNYLILAMILIAGMTAYPQATRSARETKSEKGSAKKETERRSVTRSESKSSSERKESAKAPERTRSESRSTSVERTRPTTTRTETPKARVETRSSERTQINRSTNVEKRGNNEVQRSNQEEKRRSDELKQSNENVRRSNSGASRINNESNRTTNEAVRRNNVENRGNAETGRDQIKTETRSNRENGNSVDRDLKVNSSSASRIYREGKGTLTRDDGSVVRHQNDEVFTSRKHKLDYDNYENLRRSDDFRRDFRDYDDWYGRRHVRVINHYYYNYHPLSFEVRRSRYYYRQPHLLDLIWTPLLFHRFMFYYPTHRNWDMEFGSQIGTIPADEAKEFAGTVRRVYGKVDEVFYSPEDETYMLYIGSPFPYQDLSIVVPKDIARNLSMSPKWYFENEFIWVVGLINVWEGKPEIIVRDEDQIRKY